MAIAGFGQIVNPFVPSGYAFPLEKLTAPQMRDTGISSLAEKYRLEQPELRTEAEAGKVEDKKDAKPESKADFESAGLQAGGRLAESIGGMIHKSALAELEAKQNAMLLQGRSQQAAMSQAAGSTQNALMQLIGAYRGSLR